MTKFLDFCFFSLLLYLPHTFLGKILYNILLRIHFVWKNKWTFLIVVFISLFLLWLTCYFLQCLYLDSYDIFSNYVDIIDDCNECPNSEEYPKKHDFLLDFLGIRKNYYPSHFINNNPTNIKINNSNMDDFMSMVDYKYRYHTLKASNRRYLISLLDDLYAIVKNN